VQGSDPVKLTHDATLGNRIQVGTARVEISTNVGTNVGTNVSYSKGMRESLPAWVPEVYLEN